MDDILILLLLFAVGSVAGFLNVMAGGGSTLTLPLLIFLGLNPTLANGTNRVAIFVQNIAAISSFKKENYSEFGQSMKMAVFTLPGGIIGAITAVKIGDETFKMILGIVMIAIVVNMLIPKKKKSEIEAKRPWLIYPVMFLIGFYGGFIQVGVGFILMAAINYLKSLNLVNTNMHKVFIVLIYTIPALLVFFITDNVDWKLGLGLAAGNAFGGWWAAKLQIKKGEKLVRYVMIVAILIMAVKLFGIV